MIKHHTLTHAVRGRDLKERGEREKDEQEKERERGNRNSSTFSFL